MTAPQPFPVEEAIQRLGVMQTEAEVHRDEEAADFYARLAATLRDQADEIAERIQANAGLVEENRELQAVNARLTAPVPELIGTLIDALRALDALEPRLWDNNRGYEGADIHMDVIRKALLAARSALEAAIREPIVTCECGTAPREIIKHTDDAGISWWRLATHCSACLEGAAPRPQPEKTE